MMKYFALTIVIVTLLFGCNSQTEDLPTPVKPIPRKTRNTTQGSTATGSSCAKRNSGARPGSRQAGGA